METSGSNSRGKPKKPLNLSKVTCATWRTLVGHPISMAPWPSSLLLQAISDFLKRVTRIARRESSSSCCCVLSVNVTPHPSQSVTVENPSTTALTEEEGGGGGGASWRMPSEEQVAGDEEDEKWSTSVIAATEKLKQKTKNKNQKRKTFSWNIKKEIRKMK